MRVAMLLAVLAAVACDGGQGAAKPPPIDATARCQDIQNTAENLPGITAEQLSKDYWLTQTNARDLDETILSADDIANLNAATTASAEHGAQERPPTLSRRAWLDRIWPMVGKQVSQSDFAREASTHLTRFGIFSKETGLVDSGSFVIDLAKVGQVDRKLLLDTALARGLVLLHAPGQVMFYLGKNREGAPVAIFALGHYMQACVGTPAAETKVDVNRVVISPLSLGHGSSQKSILRRLTHITVYGQPPGLALAGVAKQRAAAPVTAPPQKCQNGRHKSIFVSPLVPHRKQPLRVIATLSKDPGPTEFVLFDPDGNRHTPKVVRLGGPPYSFVATIKNPMRGVWKAVLGDGSRVDACQRIRVRTSAKLSKVDADGPVWELRREWSIASENLYAAFVERLFDYPPEESLTWPNLHTLLRDPDRNILYDHGEREEDRRITLTPDCADLPYTLRAYFAWKMGLPFGYLRCRREGSSGAPECRTDGAGDNLMSKQEFAKKDPIGAFSIFVNRHVRNSVHSASGRTLPEAELTDFYPVALSRQALRPGTLFADPYGHLLVIADWIPQGPDSYGVLIGADAQPDGTVGRRRFWRGSFLFLPDLEHGGAGFKAFRPRVLGDISQLPDAGPSEEPVDAGPTGGPDAGANNEHRPILLPLTNDELRKTRHFPRISQVQYQGSVDDFYDAMEALINPRPLDPVAMQASLVDALAEAVVRRAISVENGEKFMADNDYAEVEMPERAGIFLTVGPWEDYSTPSRDMRLLISIDTVIGFPAAVMRAPERFGIAKDKVDTVIFQLEKRLDQELGQRKLSYIRSSKKPQQLTLKDVVDRRKDFEMAYNPNDCIEIRWAAAQDSNEMASCQRRANTEQQDKMKSYRSWFATRTRPVQ